MAITATQLQDELGRTVLSPMVLRSYGTISTFQEWLITGGYTAPGRCKKLRTTASDNAATQAAAVLTALKAGPA